MDELTLELFQAISSAPELDEDGQGQACAWLTALLRLPYLTKDEKRNALVLLDFLEKMPGAEPFEPLCRAARAKLSFVVPEPWDFEFPENYRVSVDGQALGVEDLRARGIAYVDFRVNKPIRGSQEYVLIRRLYSDGRVEYLAEYQVFDRPPAGERHIFNVYGEKAVHA